MATLGLAYPGPTPDGYARLRDLVYGQGTSQETVENLYNTTQVAVQESPFGLKERYYWLSMIEFLIGRAYGYEEDKKNAAKHFDSALDYIKGSLAQTAYSEGYRLMGDIIGQLCLVKSFGYIMRHGPKVKRYAKKALALNPHNGKAHIIIASTRIYPPTAFGGDPEKGIERMKKALAMPDIARDDLFNIYAGIGVGYTKLNKTEEASLWIQKALELYPRNKFALEASMKLR